MVWKIGLLHVLESGLGHWVVEVIWTNIRLVIIYIVGGPGIV